MRRVVILVLLLIPLVASFGSAGSQNPFTTRSDSQQKAPEPVLKSTLFTKMVVWQYQLKKIMSDLILEYQDNGKPEPMLFLMGLAFAYGAIHAAGPGHGKAVAASYVFSQHPSPVSGILFGLMIAFIHGFSGIAGVFGLQYFIQSSVNESLASVTAVTQIVSFGLITVLGLGILIKHGFQLYLEVACKGERQTRTIKNGSLLPWAAAIGLVPCPAVVMVMLFCLSMDAMILGLCLSACIVTGMATTISLVVFTVTMGKAGMLNALPEKRILLVETGIGLVSGFVIAAVGTLFLIAAINSAV